MLLVPLFPTSLLGMLPMLLLPLVGFVGLAVVATLMIACAPAECLRVMSEYNEHTIVRGYLPASDRAHYLLSLRSGFRLAKGLSLAGVCMACMSVASLFWH
jgi:hypothetical protein